MIKLYESIPTRKRAVQYTGKESIEAIMELCGRDNVMIVSEDFLAVQTLEGVMQATLGDFIIRGIAGEAYPCKPEIFKASYKEVETV